MKDIFIGPYKLKPWLNEQGYDFEGWELTVRNGEQTAAYKPEWFGPATVVGTGSNPQMAMYNAKVTDEFHEYLLARLERLQCQGQK